MIVPPFKRLKQFICFGFFVFNNIYFYNKKAFERKHYNYSPKMICNNFFSV